LRSGNALVASFSIIPSTEVVEIVALGGFDAVILDMEHGPYGIDRLGPLVVAARSRGIYAIARVQRNEAALIGAALDAGADGVLVPQVTSRREAEAAVAAARFAPEGSRGAHPWVRAADFGGRAGWFQTANRDAAVIVMIEGVAGAANVADILETPHLDGIFIGPVDLSHALGVPGEIDHPTVLARIDEILARARGRSVATSIFTPSAERARMWLDRGVGLVALGVDTAHFLSALKAATAAVGRGAASG
jgi:4-hydroxy-2-oxoheptanedioate aldolase